MPYIYIKTPLYKNSKFVPHLVEHLINLKTELSPSHYFSFLKDAEMTVTATYTLIDLPKELDAMIYLEKLLEPLCIDLIPSETKAICEENTRNDYNIFALADDFDVGFDEDFFLESKKHFKNILLYSYGRKGKILSQLLFGIELTDEQIITYLDSISLEDVRVFLGKKEDYMEKRNFLSTKNQ